MMPQGRSQAMPPHVLFSMVYHSYVYEDLVWIMTMKGFFSNNVFNHVLAVFPVQE